jgi:hypothetical protein
MSTLGSSSLPVCDAEVWRAIDYFADEHNLGTCAASRRVSPVAFRSTAVRASPMLVRRFHTSDGSPWRVWAVRPATVFGERRLGERRLGGSTRGLPVGRERRTGVDRRSGQANSDWPRQSHVLPAQWQGGWLVFEPDSSMSSAPSEQLRRLAPIPADWETCADSTLTRYFEEARQASRRSA